METALIISNILLWILVLVLSLAVYALVRQVGVLYERVSPAGALMIGKGPAVGEPSPEMLLGDLNSDDDIKIGGASAEGHSSLLFFLSSTCPVCDGLIPILKMLSQAEQGWLDVIIASDGSPQEHRDFIVSKGLQQFPYTLSAELGMSFQVGKLPYAVLIDSAGIVRAHGLTNTREHIESLFEAMDRGVASIQEYLQRQQTSPTQGPANFEVLREVEK